MGSCFTENIGGKLSYFKFQNVQNPFGIVFHPVAIEALVQRALEEKSFTQNDIFLYNEQWHCFEVHSMLSSSKKADFLDTLNNALNTLRESLLCATHIIFTYGTAWAYRHQKTNSLVANCHKVPQQEFKKRVVVCGYHFRKHSEIGTVYTGCQPKCCSDRHNISGSTSQGRVCGEFAK